MIFAVGVDHAGAPLHDVATSTLTELGHEVIDLGQCDDYPDMALKMGKVIDSGEAERGILACGSGAGIAVAASKLPGIRAQTIHDTYTAHQAVEHDAVNVLCIGGRVIGSEVARELVRTFAQAEVSDEPRHLRRRAKVELLEFEGLDANLEGDS
ncbi:MAG: RpiB/LacA/LacB family sugar-phosphate isomerase [Solirubrobacteraceae bacterium]|jgi:ribose 5-phosphate isomerase B|nr:RpiB/LacA/LacB family sugar-phosphate isomerase [Solirubrobacteraceae bacterium]MBJ7342283.1 RpiB/LacA/LacB family sugar-phosphate isomerase [Solirubrobacteraceae bacterium]